MPPLVSVLMPVYNAQSFLSEAIESILFQSWADFELIAIDDGSTDQTPSILEHYRTVDPRIHVVHQQHAGLVNALNWGIDLSAGKYIARMDTDDVSLPERFAKQVRFLETHPGCSVLAAHVLLIDASGRHVGFWAQDVACLTVGEIRAQLHRMNCIPHPSIMMRAAIAKRYRYIDDQLSLEDYELWLRLTSEGHIIEKLDEVLVLYRIHPGSVTQTTNQGAAEPQRLARLRAAFLRRRFSSRRLSRFDFAVLLCLLHDTACLRFQMLRHSIDLEGVRVWSSIRRVRSR